MMWLVISMLRHSPFPRLWRHVGSFQQMEFVIFTTPHFLPYGRQVDDSNQHDCYLVRCDTLTVLPRQLARNNCECPVDFFVEVLCTNCGTHSLIHPLTSGYSNLDIFLPLALMSKTRFLDSFAHETFHTRSTAVDERRSIVAKFH